MKQTYTTLLIVIAVAAAFACSSDDVETLDCGEGTEFDEEADECVPESVDCEDDEVLDEVLGQCVRTGDAYCGAGTMLDEALGQCVADDEVECGEDTVDEDGECVPAIEVTCGEHTVAHNGECRRPDDVCAEDTEFAPSDDACRPTEGVCGEGTTFDVGTRTCIPISTLSCGPGTTADDEFVCRSTHSLYEELAESPDLDMTDEGATGEIDLADEGDRVVFVGNIDAPELVDGEYVQNEDVYHLDADAGQWLEITVYSLGLPEPAFEFIEQDGDEERFYRRSDLGMGIEVTRQVLVQSESSFELTVANMPQLLGAAPPSGGDDWGYVGYVKTLETPDAEPFELLEETKSGDIRDLSENLYSVDGAGDIDTVAFIFDEVPAHAEAELQVWSDETTIDSTIELGADAVTFEPPEDSFLLLLDRAYAAGDEISYSFSARQGAPVDDGEALYEDVELDAGDYVGVLQYNLDGHPQAATILDDDTALTSTVPLEVSNAPEGQTSLYWYAESATTVTLELVNTSGEDLDFLAFSTITGTADELGPLDGSLTESTYEQTLPRGYRHYYQVEIDTDELLAIRTEDATGDTHLELRDDSNTIVEEARNAIIFEATPGTYILSVEAQQTLDGGFSLSSEDAELFEVSDSRQPIMVIPDYDEDGITNNIIIDSCPLVYDIEVSVDITHPWRNDLIIDVVAPSGERANIHDRAGGSDDNIIATYPNPADIGLDTGEELYDLIGTNGSGTWGLHVRDVVPEYEGILNSWSIDLTCEG